MKVLKSWLNEWINLDNISDIDLSNALESLGFEIENYNQITPNYENIFHQYMILMTQYGKLV